MNQLSPSTRPSATLSPKGRGEGVTLAEYTVQAFPSAPELLASHQPSHRGCVIADSRMAPMNGLELQAARFLVADIQLRGMSGFDLQRRLRQQLPGLPIAFITAHDEPATRAQARDSGCVGYFRKPFPTGKLLEAIRSAIATNGSLNTPQGPLNP